MFTGRHLAGVGEVSKSVRGLVAAACDNRAGLPNPKGDTVSVIDSMIDKVAMCFCCGLTLKECRCSAGVPCGRCHMCAAHCEASPLCGRWWITLGETLEQKETR